MITHSFVIYHLISFAGGAYSTLFTFQHCQHFAGSWCEDMSCCAYISIHHTYKYVDWTWKQIELFLNTCGAHLKHLQTV